MEIHRPVKTNSYNQAFGSNLTCIHPITRKVVTKRGDTCPVGYADLYEHFGMKGHNGIDLGTYHGEPLYFPVIANTEWYIKTEVDREGGLGIDVYSVDPIWNGFRAKFRFWHLLSFAVHDGQKVTPGTLLGYCDNTGASSGDHLHWSMKLVDENDNTIASNNGYYGAIDFSQYYKHNSFILDFIKVRSEALSVIQLAHKVISSVKRFIESRKVDSA